MSLKLRYDFQKWMLSFLFFLALFSFYSSKGKRSEEAIKIGSKRFTESYILGELLKQVAEEIDEAPIDYRPGLGNTGIVFAALQEGLIDIYPEYTGTIALEILKDSQLSSAKPEELNSHLNSMHLGITDSLGFHDNYALAMLDKRAEELGIRSMSDLAHHSTLILGFSPEFLGRPDGWAGLKDSKYLFPQTNIKIIDHSLAYEALIQNKIDVMDIYSTDPKIKKYRLRVLDDDQHFFPTYEGVLLYRLEAVKAFPKTWTAFQQRLIHHLSTSEMMALNAQAEVEGKSFSRIARDFLHPSAFIETAATHSFWERLTGPDLWPLTRQHLFLVLGALIPAILVGLLLGIMAAYWPFTRHIILNFVGVIQTIPSLALLAFLIPIFKEIGTLPALVALFLYSLLPIVRNTYAGLANIPNSLCDAALALGLPFLYRLYLIEIPLALPMILAGIKTAAVLNVGTATIAAFIGAGGYGERIVAGLALNDYSLLLAGAIPACILAIFVQLGFDLLDHYLIPRGLEHK
jgi:osmoprotectant transport system permease protein